MELAGRAAPDGYTLAMGSFGPLAVNPWIYPKLNFDPKAFVPIILLEKSPLVLVEPMDRPFGNVNEVVAAAKARPGLLNIANAGPGGAHHLSAELFEAAAGIDMVGVPFKGGGPASTALMAGQVDLMFEQTGAAMPAIQTKKVKPIAVTSAQRLRFMPDVPTFAELGFPALNQTSWTGIAAPAGTPAAIVTALHQAIRKAATEPAMVESLKARGVIPPEEMAPAAFEKMMAERLVSYGEVVRKAGIKPE